MSMRLIEDIELFLVEFGIGEHRFGILAANNGRLVERLRLGRRIWPDTEGRVRSYMQECRKAGKLLRERVDAVA